MSKEMKWKLGVTFTLFSASDLFSLAKSTYTMLSPFLHHHIRIEELKGSWAVVTGASEGIGKAYAENLASKGLNLVLISRTQLKLDNLSENIIKEHPVQIKTCAIDFSQIQNNQTNVTKLEELLAELDVGVLVNNVGMNYSHPHYFDQVSNDLDAQIVNVNINTTNQLTKLVLPSLLKRKKGAIINVSSLVGQIPTPMLSVYAGTKAYIDIFSQSINREYHSKGIVCQSVLPGVVSTNMTKNPAVSVLICKPDVIAKKSLSRIGTHPKIIPYLPHRILMWLLNKLPDSFVANKILSLNEHLADKANNLASIKAKKRERLLSKKAQTEINNSETIKM